MNVVVIAPHPDDESIGCGGTLCKHSDRGDRVVVVFLTSGEAGLKQVPREEAWRIREAEAGRAAKFLAVAATQFLRLPDWTANEHVGDAVRLLRPILEGEKPELIYLPHPREWHPDHQAALPMLREALHNPGVPLPQLRGYEVWTPIAAYHHVEDITAVMTRKLRAVRAHRSQCAALDYARAVRGLNAYRGALAGKCRFAEVFETLELNTRG